MSIDTSEALPPTEKLSVTLTCEHMTINMSPVSGELGNELLWSSFIKLKLCKV